MMHARPATTIAPITAAIALCLVPLLAQEPDITAQSSIQILRVDGLDGTDVTVPDFGATSRPASAQEAAAHQLPAGSGFVIEAVDKDGTAAAAGLRKGDLVSRLAGRPVKSTVSATIDQFVANSFFPDEEVELAWIRDGKESTATATLTKTKSLARMFEEDVDQADIQAAVRDALAKALGADPANPAAGAPGGIGGVVRADVSISIPGTGTASQRDGKLTIKDTAGEVIYSQEKFSIDKHLEDLPADFRPAITMLMKSSGGGGILGLDFLKPDPGVEESVDDLLEKAAGEQD